MGFLFVALLLVAGPAAAGGPKLGGFELGSTFRQQSTSYLHTDGLYYHPARIAGISGAVIVTPCNGRVHEVSFRASFHPLLKLTLAAESQKLGLNYDPNFRVVAEDGFNTLRQALLTSGWVATDAKELSVPGETEMEKHWLRHPQHKIVRHLSWSCTHGMLCSVRLRQTIPQPCTEGL